MDDSMPYLEIGTEVSAKFKGAFCEAKIIKIERILKCKLQMKGSGSANETVTHDQLKNQSGQSLQHTDLKQGMVVYINKPSGTDSLQEAVLNKILDQSLYTVMFNDGDERCLKRSFIRFKGEKHFLDSETLNNAPLNNPEHFLFPIKNVNKSQQGSGETDSESEPLVPALPAVRSTRQKPVKTEKVECESANSSHAANDNEQDDENDARSDDDDNDHGRDDDNESDTSSSSDDYPTEEKDRFVAQLYKFMDERGTPMNKIPTINKIDLDLHKFFMVVKKFGGYNRVCKQRIWIDIYKKLGLPLTNASNVVNLKSAYERLLYLLFFLISNLFHFG